MGDPFVGSHAMASGALTRHELRTRFVAVHRDIYVAKGTRPTALVRAKAAWLRSRGHGILAGFSASAFHGARWIDPGLPAYVIDHNNRRAARGIVTWADAIEDGEICQIGGIRLTTPARTAVDLACKFPEDTAVAAIDALARAAHLKVSDIESAADRHSGRKGIKQARTTIALVDPGAESPQETWLRLLVVRAGYPAPQSQYPVYNEYGALIGEVDLAWAGVEDRARVRRRSSHRPGAASQGHPAGRRDDRDGMEPSSGSLAGTAPPTCSAGSPKLVPRV